MAVHTGGKAAHHGEFVRQGKTDLQCAVAAHGQAGNELFFALSGKVEVAGADLRHFLRHIIEIAEAVFLVCVCTQMGGHHDDRHTLPLHELHPDEEYYLGVFLVGAYQETLGDLHNLLGDTNVVSVTISPEDGRFEIVKELEGDSVADVLSYVEYSPQDLVERFRKGKQMLREANAK